MKLYFPFRYSYSLYFLFCYNFISIRTDSIDSNRIQRVHNLTLAYSGNLSDSTVGGHNHSVFCVWNPWSFWRDVNPFKLDEIDGSLCTHILYMGSQINATINDIIPDDPYLEDPILRLEWLTKIPQLKSKYKHLKFILNVGNWKNGVKDFQAISSNGDKRQAFLNNAEKYLKKYKFDGINLSWMWPTADYRGGHPDDRKNLNILLVHLRDSMKMSGLSLSIMTAPDFPFASLAYDWPRVSSFVDYLIIHSVSFKGDWTLETGHHSNLHDSDVEGENPNPQSISKTLKSLKSHRVDMSKVVLLISASGRSFNIVNSANVSGSGFGTESKEGGFQARFDNSVQELGYDEICHELTSQESPWEVYNDTLASALFMRNGAKWVSFDDLQSIRNKVDFGLKIGVKRFGIFPIDQDDFQGKYCGSGNATFPFLRTLNEALTLHERTRTRTTPTPTTRTTTGISNSNRIYWNKLLYCVNIIIISRMTK